MNIINNYTAIQDYIKKSYPSKNNIKIISVSKTFNEDKILPLLQNSNIHFGENKVQEAQSKWTNLRKDYPNIKLHMIGKLQTNKVKQAVKVFDYIHSIDNEKLVNALSKTESDSNKKLNYFIQVNLGNEEQKSGIPKNILDDFYYFCTKEKNLNIIGLMAIPPNDGNEKGYFKYLDEANKSLGLKELSMGMTADYKTALAFNSTFLRIGSLIFGERSSK